MLVFIHRSSPINHCPTGKHSLGSIYTCVCSGAKICMVKSRNGSTDWFLMHKRYKHVFFPCSDGGGSNLGGEKLDSNKQYSYVDYVK